MAESNELHIVFDGPPGPEAGRFVEVETASSRGVRAGRWEARGDYWHLILTPADFARLQADQRLRTPGMCMECGLIVAPGNARHCAAPDCPVQYEIAEIDGALAKATGDQT